MNLKPTSSSMLHQIPNLEKPQRLDHYLSQLYPKTSRNYWKKHLDGCVLLNGRKVKKGDQVFGGENLEVLQAPQLGPEFLAANPKISLKVLYEDPDLIALNKAPGLHCIPLKSSETHTLVNALLAHYPEQREVEEKLDCGLLQRLDKETSGLVLVARRKKIKEVYLKQQAAGKVFKQYLAWVEGVPAQKEGFIKSPLAHHPKNPKKMIALKDPKEAQKLKARPALTEWQLLKTQGDQSLLRLGITKGSRHQLRVHLASLGHPIVGDPLYQGPSQKRLLLHAESMSLKHPVTQKKLFLNAPIDKDFHPQRGSRPCLRAK